jgi:hypothetical protein
MRTRMSLRSSGLRLLVGTISDNRPTVALMVFSIGPGNFESERTETYIIRATVVAIFLFPSTLK